MAKPAARIAAIQLGFALGVLGILARAVQLQIVDGEQWKKEAESKRTERRVLQARRGALYDRNMLPLAITQEFYHVGIAPNELEDPGSAFRVLVRNLGSSRVRSIASSAPASAGSISTVHSTRPRSSRFARSRGSISRAPSSASIPRVSWRGRSSAGSRPTARGAPPGSSWRSTPF